MLPILHLNGWKIANPTLLARMDHDELEQLFRGYGYDPRFVEGDDAKALHPHMAQTLDAALDRIAEIQHEARRNGFLARPAWPMIVLRTPKGWTGPSEVEGLPMEGTWRSHQVPLAHLRENPEALIALEQWMRSYRPGPSMPTIPPLGTGLTLVLQWLVIPFAALARVRRLASRGSQAS